MPILRLQALYSLNFPKISRLLTHPARCNYPAQRALHIVIPGNGPSWPETHLTESYIHNPSQIPFLSTTLGRLIEYQARTIGDRVGFVVAFQNIRKTYAQFSQDASDLANGLVSLGLQPGDRIGIWGTNSYEWMVIFFAASKAGLILVNVNPAYKVPELEYCLNKVQMKAIIAAEGVGPLNYYDYFQKLHPEIHNSAPGNLQSTRLPHLKHIIMLTKTPEKFPGTYSYDAVVSMKRQDNVREVEKRTKLLQSDDAFNIQFTSGTTGTPKGASLSSFGIINAAYFCGHRLGAMTKTKAMVVPLPLFHIFGCVGNLLISCIFGMKCVLPSPRFEPEAVFKAIQDEECQSISAVPTMFRDLVNHPNLANYNLSSLNVALMGGAPCPPELLKALNEKLGIKQVAAGYGATEQSVATFFGILGDPAEISTTTTGYPLSHVEAKVIDVDGRIVPIGEKGELCTRSFGTMLGYWDEEDKTREIIGPDRWMKTGDLAKLTEKGYLKIVGRAKDMVVRGGENVYPVEIENVLLEHEHVLDVHIHGVPDDRLGEEICAWIRLHDHAEMIKARDELETALTEFVRKKLAKYKSPRYYIFYESPLDIPMTPSGKVKKFELTDMAKTRLGLGGKTTFQSS
ncbi:medium-chain acyl-CoA ligase ACSF2, mitochondrial-like [Paramacrobiotus metropolitanus]|uniref:medium-chain acyl-CoA ligase ACSF2, mitochondrial-like n=1 Tax=Paramacrobiotus metropolitanus TaxID=2943436 RepID=UPI002446586C|nr:medium-chain acyl-CoA ligase ACSF2, mitochondrial-like [Paramacrobiotus metropolitanus]